MVLDLLRVAVLIVIEHRDAGLIDWAVGAGDRPGIPSQHPVVAALPSAVVSPGTNPTKLVTERLVEAKKAAVVSRATAGVPSAEVETMWDPQGPSCIRSVVTAWRTRRRVYETVWPVANSIDCRFQSVGK